MKYDDDEIAEAALLLGVVESDATRGGGARASLPADLERRILEQARAALPTPEVRQPVKRESTTQGGALSLALTLNEKTTTGVADGAGDASRLSGSSETRRARGSAYQKVTSWVPWLAAAACFAFAIYEWRVSTRLPPPSFNASPGESAPRPPAAPLAPVPIVVVRDKVSNRAIADVVNVTCSPAASTNGLRGEIHVRDLPLLKSDEHYRVWIRSTSTPAVERVVGSFSCVARSDCEDRFFSFAAPALPSAEGDDCTRDMNVVITRNNTNDPSTLTSANVVGEGRRQAAKP